ncbi:hypothetical protein B1H19_00195 [Streptomyces gilvosporeus]|uniref:DUF4352 domain-containing protein n=2 Tax=Streptomyces gilvosporeus TaxID=553510 RepID=A0A1V0TIT4_9ACTN|nr:hypothetical protein B1H19_00195 [Streptomyces gilvosporeus]
MGKPAPKLYEPEVSGGGRFQVAAKKIVKGTPEQLKEGHLDDEGLGDTPYFVYVTYTLKAGKPEVSNPDLNANAVALDENGEEAAKRPTVHTGYVEGGCPVPDAYTGWDVGESRTLCSVYIGDAAKQPTRLAWNPDAQSADDYKKGSSWRWTTR